MKKYGLMFFFTGLMIFVLSLVWLWIKIFKIGDKMLSIPVSSNLILFAIGIFLIGTGALLLKARNT